MPLTVGGGVRTLEDIHDLLNAGADKVSINTAAVQNPLFIQKASQRFGSQCIVIAIDAKRAEGFSARHKKWLVYTHGGREKTNLDAIEWAKRTEKLGAGEILLTSMDRDGTKQGYDLELLRMTSERIGIPVIASGGVGTLEHLAQGFLRGKADAALAASIFHYREHTVGDAKDYLRRQGVCVRS